MNMDEFKFNQTISDLKEFNNNTSQTNKESKKRNMQSIKNSKKQY